MVFKMPEQAEGLKVAVTKTAHLLLVGLTVMGKSLVYMLPFSSVLYDLITWWQLSSFPSFCCMQTFHSKLSMVPTTFWTSEDINNVCLPWAYPNKEIPWVYPIPSSQQQTCKVCHQQTPFYSSTCRLLLLLHKLEATYHCGQVFFFQPLNRFCTKFQKQRFLSCYWWQLVHCLSPPHCLNPLYCQVKDSTEKIGKLIRCKSFHSDILETKREVRFKDWVQGKEQAYNFLMSWSVMYFVQGSGWAGRGGKQAESYVFSSKRERDEPDPEDQFGKKIMRDWVLQKSACWQVVLSSFLNDQVIIYTLLQNVNLWYLQKEDGEALPKVLYQTFPHVSPTDIPKVGPLSPIPPSLAQYMRKMFQPLETQE